jgi:hypothetical protein
MNSVMGARVGSRGPRRLGQGVSVAAALFLAACVAPAGDEGSGEPVESASSELKNGTTIFASNRFTGVVLLEVRDPVSGSWTPCTGFVGSSIGFVTAAHCLTLATNGAFTGPVQFTATRENTNGTWTTIVSQKFGLAFIHPSYTGPAAHDVGVIRFPVAMNGVLGPADALAMSKSAPSGESMAAVGHGFFDVGANNWDRRVRTGLVTPTYDSGNLQYNFSANPASKPWICSGDSGGPLRRSENVWVTYGIASGFSGNQPGARCGPVGRWATTRDNWTWLKSVLGNCTETAARISCW